MMSRDTPNLVDLATLREANHQRDARVWGVLLTAGTSSRFGAENKLLRRFRGKPLVTHAAESLIASDLDGVTVVLGHDKAAIRRALASYPVKFSVNPAFDAGQSTSVRTGVRDAEDADADAVLVALGDMPSVSVTTVNRLVDAARADLAGIVAAAFDGVRGNPVVFDAAYFDNLLAIDGDQGARRLLLKSEDAVCLETQDPGVLQDVDRPADLERVDLAQDPGDGS